MALLAPLAAGALVLLAAAVRGLALPWTAAGLALAGNVLFGFAVACVARTRTGEPGAAAGTAVVLVLMAPSLVPQVARWVRTFPAPGAGGPSSDPVWWTVLAVCVVAIAIAVDGRRLPRWMSRVPLSGDDDPGDTHRASRPAAPSTLRRSSRSTDSGVSAATQPGRPYNPNSRCVCRYETVPAIRASMPHFFRATGQ